ncbi:MAG: hypothetical protein QXL94_03065 [Candidatus Parvarchaeum sp.]
MMSNSIISRYYGNNSSNTVMPSITGPGVAIQLNINFPFSKLLDGLVDQVKNGNLSLDAYLAMLDQYEVIIGKYRDIKV